MSEWISVHEKIPIEGIQVLCTSPDRGLFIARRGSKFSRLTGREESRWEEWGQDAFENMDWINAGIVTHWMPLPEPPK